MTTSPVILDPRSTHPELDPSRNIRYAVTTALAVAAPILFTISNVALPRLSGSTADVVAQLPGVLDRLLVVKLFYALGSALMITLVIALWRVTVTRGGIVRLVGGVLVIFGAGCNALGEVVDGYLAFGMHGGAVAAASQVKVFDLLDSATAALPISFLAIPVMSLGLVVMMVGVAMARVVPVWLPALTIVGGIAAGFVGVGVLSLIGLLWALPVAAIAVIVSRRP